MKYISLIAILALSLYAKDVLPESNVTDVNVTIPLVIEPIQIKACGEKFTLGQKFKTRWAVKQKGKNKESIYKKETKKEKCLVKTKNGFIDQIFKEENFYVSKISVPYVFLDMPFKYGVLKRGYDESFKDVEKLKLDLKQPGLELVTLLYFNSKNYTKIIYECEENCSVSYETGYLEEVIEED